MGGSRNHDAGTLLCNNLLEIPVESFKADYVGRFYRSLILCSKNSIFVNKTFCQIATP